MFTQWAVYTVAGVKHILLSSVSFTVCAAVGLKPDFSCFPEITLPLNGSQKVISTHRRSVCGSAGSEV